MTLLLALLGLSISPADSARALVTLRSIPPAAVHYAQMAAAVEGPWMVEYGRLLEASGNFTAAGRIYGLALGRSTSEGSARWLMNRIRGTAVLDTTLVISVMVTNRGNTTARNIQVLLPEPEPHPPFQDLSVICSDFQNEGGMLSADIPCLVPGDTATLTISLALLQRPGTARPLPGAISDEALERISSIIRNMPVPEALPGPCVPMSQELARQAAAHGIDMSLVGGVLVDGSELVFHAWAETGSGIRVDPLLFISDSLLATGHCPTDVIPLWKLDSTDGYELTILYDSRNYLLSGDMTASFK